MKKKKELFVVGILIGIFCVIGVSYAIWQVTHVQTGENSLTVGCFKVEFTDANPIQIGKAYPIEDKVGKTLTPYEFTITNACNDLAAYQINLEVLNDTTMNEYGYIKTMLDEERPNLLTTNQVVEKTLENANTAYKLKKGYLKELESKTFTLRLWLDESTPPDEEIMNMIFKSKVTITTTFLDELPLASKTLRSITGWDDESGMWQYKSQITKVIIENELKPKEEAIGSFDESLAQDGSVMSYVVENKKENETDETTYTAYLQSDEKLYLSSGYYLFYEFQKLETIEGMRYIDTSNVTDMNSMFRDCNSLTTIDVSTFNTEKVRDMYFIFADCNSLTTLNLSNFNTSNVPNMDYMFSGCSSLTELNLSNFNTSNVTNMSNMFFGCSSLTSLDVSTFNTEKVIDMSNMFEGCSSLTILDVSNFNTEKVSNISRMFYECSSLNTLNLSTFNTSNVTNMSAMFFYCGSLTSLNLSNFNTEKVTDMHYMFYGCCKLPTLDLSNFNTGNVTDMNFMFKDCSSLTSLDVSTFNTEKVTDMNSMFEYCSSLTTLDVSNFNTQNVYDMSGMFDGCINLTTLDVSNFNTEKAYRMNSMFSHCSSLTTLDLSNFNTLKVNDMSGIFYLCKGLTTIIYGENFIHRNDADVSNMFDDCPANKPTHESWNGVTV